MLGFFQSESVYVILLNRSLLHTSTLQPRTLLTTSCARAYAALQRPTLPLQLFYWCPVSPAPLHRIMSTQLPKICLHKLSFVLSPSLTADVNFASELSDLRHRHGFRVILIHGNQTSSALLQHAHCHVPFQEITADLPPCMLVKSQVGFYQ